MKPNTLAILSLLLFAALTPTHQQNSAVIIVPQFQPSSPQGLDAQQRSADAAITVPQSIAGALTSNQQPTVDNQSSNDLEIQNNADNQVTISALNSYQSPDTAAVVPQNLTNALINNQQPIVNSLFGSNLQIQNNTDNQVTVIILNPYSSPDTMIVVPQNLTNALNVNRTSIGSTQSLFPRRRRQSGTERQNNLDRRSKSDTSDTSDTTDTSDPSDTSDKSDKKGKKDKSDERDKPKSPRRNNRRGPSALAGPGGRNIVAGPRGRNVPTGPRGRNVPAGPRGRNVPAGPRGRNFLTGPQRPNAQQRPFGAASIGSQNLTNAITNNLQVQNNTGNQITVIALNSSRSPDTVIIVPQNLTNTLTNNQQPIFNNLSGSGLQIQNNTDDQITVINLNSYRSPNTVIIVPQNLTNALITNSENRNNLDTQLPTLGAASQAAQNLANAITNTLPIQNNTSLPTAINNLRSYELTASPASNGYTIAVTRPQDLQQNQVLTSNIVSQNVQAEQLSNSENDRERGNRNLRGV